jgi:exopolysaccharide biosynthesis predicted pyruvyltransferase EpsI
LFNSVETSLQSLKNEQLVFVPCPGNAGDSFLAHSAYQLFDKLGLRYKIGVPTGYYPDDAIILGGGGNLVHPYPNLVRFLRRNMNKWRHLIILPHTIRSYSDELSQLDTKCTIFCRERRSYEYTKEHARKANVILSHDLAFSCDLNQTRHCASGWFQDPLHPTLIIRNAKRHARTKIFDLKTHGSRSILNAFRTDVEASTKKTPAHNMDVSQAFAADDMLPISSRHATRWMMRFLDQFIAVRTDRLHVGIMCALLGKTVHLHDNSYGKNKDVYDNSIVDRYNNVHWHPTREAS